MSQLLWISIAWLGGTALILGSLMTLGSLVLLIAPTIPAPHAKAASAELVPSTKSWHKLKLLTLSLTLTLVGWELLAIFPFPQANL